MLAGGSEILFRSEMLLGSGKAFWLTKGIELQRGGPQNGGKNPQAQS